MRNAAAVALVAVLAAAHAGAEEIFVIDRSPTYSPLWRIDTESGAVSPAGPTEYWPGIDLAMGPSGLLYAADTDAIVSCQPGQFVRPWVILSDAVDVAVRSNGDVVGVNQAFGHDGVSELAVFRADGTLLWRERPSDLELIGIDVPHAGPAEDAIVALGYDSGGQWWVQVWQPQPDGSVRALERHGPLDAPSRFACILDCPRHPTMARDGESFFVVEPEMGIVRRHSLDGTSLGIFATIPEDAMALASGVLGARNDWPMNLFPLEDGGLVVVTARRVHVLDASGTIVRTIDHVFGYARAVAPVVPIPFESAGVRCRPWSVGFWKRQCATLGDRRRPVSGRGPRGTSFGQPPLHPAMSSIVDLAATVERANRWLEPHGLTACAALQPDAPNTWREKALRRYAAVALNFEYKMLGRRCDVTVDGLQRTVGDVLDEVRTLLGSANDDDLKRAFQLTGDTLGEVSE